MVQLKVCRTGNSVGAVLPEEAPRCCGSGKATGCT